MEKNYSNFFYRNPRLMLLVLCLIAVSGLSSVFLLPRMEDPALVQRGAFVNTIFPGADPSLVESLVSEKIEDALDEIEEIKEVRSTSREGISTIAIELRDEVLDSDRVWSRIRDRLDDVRSSLPPGALRPDFLEMDFKAFALLVALRWDDDTPVNYSVLRRLSQDLRDRLQSVTGTERVDIFGAPSEEILVTLDPRELAALGLTIADVSRQISASDAKSSSGQIRGTESEMLIDLDGQLDSLARIENIPIRFASDGNFCQLGTLGTVDKTVTDPPDSISIVSGQHSICLGALVRPSNRIDLWQDNIEIALEKFSQSLPPGIGLDRVFNQNDYVMARLSTLTGNLIMGAIAVFVVIFFLMGWRNAIVVSLALPLSAMMVLFSMRLTEIPIHQMSITGLIIALGLLIDNAIVIVDEITTRMRKGVRAGAAVTSSVHHLFLPLLGSTLTTAFAFAPIALMPGPAGEFVGAVAINVIFAIFSSFFLAMTILPAIAAMLSPFRNVEVATDEPAATTWFKSGFSNATLSRGYQAMLGFLFKRPLVGVGVGVLFPMIGFIQAGNLHEQFFPPADRDQLHIELELASQSSIQNSLGIVEDVRAVLLEDEAVSRVDWFVGRSAPAFYYNLIPRRSNISQYAQALVKLKSADGLHQVIHRLQDRMDNEFSEARILVRQLEQGPPFDAPVEVRLFGPDLDRLNDLGNELRKILAETPNVLHTRAELDEVLPKIDLKIDEERLRAAGLSYAEVASQLNASTEGRIGGSIVEATEQMPVRVRLANSERGSLQSVASLDLIDPSRAARVAGQANREVAYTGVPLTTVADIGLKPEYGSIVHLAGRRMNEIQVYIPAGILPSSVLSEFQNNLAESDFKLPECYALTYGGEAAKRDEAVGNLMASVGILAVMMIATLVMAFGSFRLAAIILSVAALAVGLGMNSLWLFGFPFGFTSIIGTMGLIGVAINDTIVVLAAIRGDEQARAGHIDALRRVVGESTRHIVSTTLTTIAGFMPLILGGGGFWPPMAICLAGGVVGATILALIFVPSAYLLTMRIGSFVGR